MTPSIGDRIWARRRQCYLTRRELADVVGVTESTVYGWERGLSRPRPRYLEKIEHRLGFEPGELLKMTHYAD